jgi:hypothetical protein
MVSGAVATVTVEEAVRVRVEVAAPLAPVGVTELEDQVAVTPEGSPVRARVTGVENDPPVAMEMTLVAVAPCCTVSEEDAGVTVSAGVMVTARVAVWVEL